MHNCTQNLKTDFPDIDVTLPLVFGESSVFLPAREEIHAHLHSKLKEGFVSVAAFQPLVSYVISSLRRIEHSCQQGKRLDKKEVHAHLHSKLKEWFVSVGAFQPQVSDIISRLRRVEYSCQQEDRDQIWSVHICSENLHSKLIV